MNRLKPLLGLTLAAALLMHPPGLVRPLAQDGGGGAHLRPLLQQRHAAQGGA